MAQRAESMTVRTDFSLLIDGKLEQSDLHLDVINPAFGEVFARCPREEPPMYPLPDGASRCFLEDPAESQAAAG